METNYFKIISKLFIVFVFLFGFLLTSFNGSVLASTVDEVHGGVSGVGGGSTASGTSEVRAVIYTVVNILLFLVGSFAVIMIVIAGFRFVTANGDANTVSQAKNTIIYSVIGIVVAIMAWGIVNFILGAFT